ncbi:MAG TPA: hypothetical protein VKE74_04065 [Gemmataceae bacterium]|nr:hypothetical protein [Gemmataceae bacterium]
MQRLLAVTVVLGAVGLTPAQPPPPKAPEAPPVRFGLPYRPKAYPQATPKQALESVIITVEKGEFPYLVAHLLDPAFVDTRLAERARQFEPLVEDELVKLRALQKQNPDRVAPEARVPDDLGRLRALVADRAHERAFRQLARDVQEKLADDPEALKELRQFLRLGMFPDAGAGDTARVGLPKIKERALFFRKIGDRWFVENRQADERKPPAESKPDEKKD